MASGQKALTLIVARELASNLATPMFLIDAVGDLVFYNEAAERIIGLPFSDVGEIDSVEWGRRLQLADEDGAHLSLRETPPWVAFNDRHPAHRFLCAMSHDGTRTNVECTAYPLFANEAEMHGVVAIFWEVDR